MEKITKAGVNVDKNSHAMDSLNVIEALGIRLDRVSRVYTEIPEEDPLLRIEHFYNQTTHVDLMDYRTDPGALKSSLIQTAWCAVQAEEMLLHVTPEEKHLAEIHVHCILARLSTLLQLYTASTTKKNQGDVVRKVGIESHFKEKPKVKSGKK